MTGGCPICHVPHAACGQPSASGGIDETIEEAIVGGPLRIYDVVLPNGTRTRMQLNEADAKRYNATPVEEAPVRDKMRTPHSASRRRTGTRSRS